MTGLINHEYWKVKHKLRSTLYKPIYKKGSVITCRPLDRRNAATFTSVLRCFDKTGGGVRIRTLPVGRVLATRR